MTCKPCVEGNHRACEKGDCECNLVEIQIEQEIARETGGEVAMAETIYSNLLYGGSAAARILVDGAGKSVVKLFIQQVLRANKASRC